MLMRLTHEEPCSTSNIGRSESPSTGAPVADLAHHSKGPNRVVGNPQAEPKDQIDQLFHLRSSRSLEARVNP